MPVPIAVVGIGCRFPGAHGVEEFWVLLRDGRDATTEVPADRFDVDAVYDPRPGIPGKIPTRRGGFLDRVDEFDAAFFGISPREAAHMDPQQRLLLEVAWEAIEDAGLTPGRRTGVFVGQMTANYWDLLSRASALDIYTNLGTTRSALAGRLSYAFDLRGPSISVDTACSSSLAAVHLACQSLRRGECQLALAGGVNVILHPEETVTFAQAKMISPDGRCKFASATADGFVRSDGVGVVVLKPLREALADGDAVYAVIHGSAVGNDGRASGYLMSPAREGQAETLRDAYADAGIDPAQVGYVEAHGTGSEAGDPVELAALQDVFRAPLLVGSVKTNIGHTEAAAGIAGLIKAVLCVRNRRIPASLHSARLTSAVDWESAPISIAREPTAWPAGRAVAGISSFGISGGNAHVVLAEAPAGDPPAAESGEPRLLTLSAREPAALRALVASYADHLDGPVRDICYTAATRRRHHEHRLTVVGSTGAEITGKLRAHLAGQPVPGLRTAADVHDRKARIAYVFPGQGAQWTGMGRELLKTSPVFREAIGECDRAIAAEAGWSVVDRLSTGRLDSIDVIQPALWAMEVALAAVWRSFGVGPDLVIGHSMGEVAAACVAGMLDPADGAAVICRRSRLLARVVGQGAMMSVELSEEEARREIAGLADRVSVAVSNGPGSTVLSGDREALDLLGARLDERMVFRRHVDVDVASHSPQMDPLTDQLVKQLDSVTARPSTTPLWSTVLGEPVQTVDAAYWARNLREPVCFGQAVSAVLDEGPAIFIELSPHPILAPAITEALDEPATSGTVVPSLRREEPEAASLLDGLGAIHLAGHPVPWERLYGPECRVVRLPGYPWQRRRFWLDSGPATSDRHVSEHPVDLPYLADHQVRGEPVLPGTAYVAMVVAAARNALGDTPVLREIAYRNALFLREDTPSPVRVTLARDRDDSWRFEVGRGGTVHADGRLDASTVPSRGRAASDRDDLLRHHDRHLTGAEFYARSAAAGNQWLGVFQGIAELWCRDDRAVGRIEVPPDVDGHHPAVLDACCQVLAATGQRGAFLLAGIDEVRLHRPLTGRLWCQAVVTGSGEAGTLVGDIAVTGEDGDALADLTGLRLRYLDASPDPGGRLYELRWRRRPALSPPPGPAPTARNWVVFADAGGVGEALADLLRRSGRRCMVVTAGSRFERPEPGRYQIDPASEADYRGVLTEAGNAVVAHLWSLDADSAQDAERLGCGSVLLLSHALLAAPAQLVEAAPGAGIWLVTRGAQRVGEAPVSPDQALLWGFGRALAQEHPGWRPALVDLEPEPGSGAADLLYTEMTGESDGEREIAFRAGERHVCRLVRRPVTDATPRMRGTQRVGTDAPGLLGAIGLRPAARPEPAPGEVEIETGFAALNYRDVLSAMNSYPGQDGEPLAPGWECAGTVSAVGDRVAGLHPGDQVVAVAHPALATHVRADARLAFLRPARLSAQEAATMPVAFLTAFHSLCGLARLRQGERVLIHAAAGGVGLAAVQVARWKGAEILATAGSPEKRALLSMLGVRHVADSRSLRFADEVRAVTRGEGVDVVLNCLTGEAVPANLSLLRPYGRYVELAKRDLLGGAHLDLRPLARNLSFHAVDIADMILSCPDQAAETLREILALAEAGLFTPLPHAVFPAAEVSGAFRHLARSRHIGKVVVSFDEARPAANGADRAREVQPVADGTYLVTGGLGDLGLVVARWLAESGARHILLIGRTPLPANADHAALRELERSGAEVAYVAVDVADEAALRALLDRRRAEGRPAVRGVVHAAGVVAFRTVGELDPVDLAAVLRPKVAGGWALHHALQDERLDFFVLFSSGSAILGSPMLAGYAAANAFLDALAHHRRAAGLPALAVDWGFWSGTGMAARFEAEHGRPLVPRGMSGFSPAEGIEALRTLMAGDVTQGLVMAADWDRWRAAHPQAAQAPLLSELFPAEETAPPAAPSARDGTRTGPPSRDEMDHALAVPATVGNPAAVEEYLIGRVAEVLGVAAPQVSPRRPLKDQGIDSLMAVEVRTHVRQDLGVLLPVAKMLGDRTVAELAAELSESSGRSDRGGSAGVRATATRARGR